MSWVKELSEGYSLYVHRRDHAVWLLLYKVQEQAGLIYGDRSHNITTVVISGTGIGLPKRTSWGMRKLNVLSLKMSGGYRDIYIYKNSLSYTLKISVHYTLYFSKKIKNKFMLHSLKLADVNKMDS